MSAGAFTHVRSPALSVAASALADRRGSRSWKRRIRGAPYLFLGEADYAEHRGERPIAITWHLRTPMPTADFAVASVVM